jgi:hypothetical protein
MVSGGGGDGGLSGAAAILSGVMGRGSSQPQEPAAPAGR